MADLKLRKVMRCPVCFARENDVTLYPASGPALKIGEHGAVKEEGEVNAEAQYYCVKCSFHGSAAEIAAMYTDLRKKYRWMLKRSTLDELRLL